MTEPRNDDEDMLDWLRRQPPDEQERILSHASLIGPARDFVEKVWGERDLRAAWPLTDPLLRTCLAQKWVWDNRADVEADGWDRERIVEAFANESPTHPLWRHFERVHLRGFSQWDDLTEWGTGTGTRLHSPDVEAVVFLPPGVQVWKADEVQQVYTFLMRHEPDAGWRVLNIGSEMIPEPGWPPRLAPDE